MLLFVKRCSVFFFISNKDVYSRKLPYAEKHKAEKNYKKRREKKKIKKKKKKEKKDRKKEKILITKERAKKHRERITSGESQSPRPVIKGATERSQ